MKTYDISNISEILDCYYHDMRTDYVWKYLVEGVTMPSHLIIHIPNLESFEAMQQMLTHRRNSISRFLQEWEESAYSKLFEVRYNERSGILQLKCRTFRFVYRTKTNEYCFKVYAGVARKISLIKAITLKKYAKGGLFPFLYAIELDRQLFQRYKAVCDFEDWIRSEQFDRDIEYCHNMLPTIIKYASTTNIYLDDFSLNIILEGTDRVRIGLVKNYTPEEMYALTSYERSAWEEGVKSVFNFLEKRYNTEVNDLRESMEKLSKALTDAIQGQYSIDQEELSNNFFYQKSNATIYTYYLDCVMHERQFLRIWSHEVKMSEAEIMNFINERKSKEKIKKIFNTDTFTFKINKSRHSATITMKDEEMAKMIGAEPITEDFDIRGHLITPAVLEQYNQDILQEYEGFLQCIKKINRPQHQGIVEALKYIIKLTSPVIANSTITRIIETDLSWDIDENDYISIWVTFDGRKASCTFSHTEIKSRLRIWWSQWLLKECKYVKEVALHPEDYLFENQP